MSEENITEITPQEIKKLQLIYEITKQFQGTLNLKVLMNQILAKIIEELNAEAGSFFMVDESAKEIVCTEAIGPARDKVLNIRIPMGKGIVGWCISTKKPTIIYDTSKDKRFQANVDDKTGFITKSVLCVPIVHQKKSLGAVELFNKKSEDGKFVDHDMEILQVIADNAAASLNNAKLHEVEQKLKERSLIMNEFAKAFNATLELEKLLSMVLKKTTNALDCEASSIWLFDDQDSNKLVCKIAEGPGKTKIVGVKLPVGTGIVGSVVKDNKMETVLDAESDERFASKLDDHTGFKTHSMLCIPFTDGDSAVGCIQVINKKTGTHKFSKDDINLLQSVAAIASISIKNAQMYEREKKIDELSSLLKISRDLSASLDYDSIAVTFVNLTSELIKYDRAILLTENKPGKFSITAVSGMGGNFDHDESLNHLLSIASLILENKPENYFPNIDDYLNLPTAVDQFKKYFELAAIKSFYCRELSDTEGKIGVIIFESKTVSVMPEEKKEALDVLCNQVVTALRNAQLYQTVPKFDIFGSKGKKKGIKKFIAAGIIILAIAALHFIKINYTITSEAEIIPMRKKFIYPKVDGLLKKIYIQDGDIVNKGDIIAEIDDKDYRFQIKKLINKTEMIKKDILKFKMLHSLPELAAKQNDLILTKNTINDIKEKISNTKIIAPISGQLILKDADAKVGEFISRGSKLADIVDLKKVKAKILVPEEKIQHVKKGYTVNLKFAAFPMNIKKSKIEYMDVEGELNEVSNVYYYPVYSIIDNESENLKISMTGNGRIRGKKISILSYILETPINYFYMNYKW